jgi:hypothetical protein
VVRAREHENIFFTAVSSSAVVGARSASFAAVSGSAGRAVDSTLPGAAVFALRAAFSDEAATTGDSRAADAPVTTVTGRALLRGSASTIRATLFCGPASTSHACRLGSAFSARERNAAVRTAVACRGAAVPAAALAAAALATPLSATSTPARSVAVRAVEVILAASDGG